MPASERYQRLQRRIDDLGRRLVPKTRTSGKYTIEEQDLIRAYRLLAHAEFEAFLEDRSIEVAEKALKSYSAKKKTGDALAAMMTFSPLATQSPPTNKSSSNFDPPQQRVFRVISQYKNSVSQGNHGIKEANVLSMLFPIGFLASEIDSTLLATLNSYGSSRGSTAHQSFRTQSPIDPVTEVVTVKWIVAEFKNLDTLISTKKRAN